MNLEIKAWELNERWEKEWSEGSGIAKVVETGSVCNTAYYFTLEIPQRGKYTEERGGGMGRGLGVKGIWSGKFRPPTRPSPPPPPNPPSCIG